MKRFFDVLLAAVGLVLAGPFLALAALLIRLDSAGPILFRQSRVGIDGRLFSIYKLRTMVEDAEKLGPPITAKNDPRVTQIGQVLRWLKIDELPQLWNVLKGDMSLVGPRPEVPAIVQGYTDEQRKVLSVRPGILGPSQVEGRDESDRIAGKEDVEAFYRGTIMPEKLARDLAYIRNRDPLKDLKILVGGGVLVLLGSIKVRYILESRRRFFFLCFDLAMAAVTYWLAFLLRFDGAIPPADKQVLLTLLPFVLVLRGPCFIYFGLYQTLWQYLGIQELLAIIRAVTVGSLLIPFVPFLLQVPFQPRSTVVIDWFLLVVALGGSRIFFKLSADRLKSLKLGSRKNVLLVGAGDTAELLIREFIKRPELGSRPAGLIDNDPKKIGMRIHGVKVMGSVAEIPQIAKMKKIDELVIALPQARGESIKEILQKCRGIGLPCRIVPHALTTLSPAVMPLRLRPVDISDLLGREIVTADVDGIHHFLRDKRVLVTGAGGSIGSELARAIFESRPRELILVDRTENNLYEVETDLSAVSSETRPSFYLRDVTSAADMEKIFEAHRPQVIYHAAAHKHVPLTEMHYAQGILTNVLGTKVMADLALGYEAERFVLISTDKAIRPVSIMGATKRIAELYLQSRRAAGTRFLSVRFGNVFNSRGSVIPLFRRQIETGGPITLTHPEVSRYFMDVSEAVFLILQATLLGADSEIFVLDMGKPVKILDLARDLIQLYGLSPEHFPIRTVGLRPGEKLHEELELAGERALATPHEKIKIWRSDKAASERVPALVDELIRLAREGAGREAVLAKIQEIVPEFEPAKPA